MSVVKAGIEDFLYNILTVGFVFIGYWLVEMLIYKTNPNIHWMGVVVLCLVYALILMLILYLVKGAVHTVSNNLAASVSGNSDPVAANSSK